MDDLNFLSVQCDFEQGLCNFQQEAEANVEWQVHSGPTLTKSTGPSIDHTILDKTGIKQGLIMDFFSNYCRILFDILLEKDKV